jgi:hypothetical protein
MREPRANRRRRPGIDLARKLNERWFAATPPQKEPTMTTRLADIATRQRNTRIRDAVFTCVVALATLLGTTAVGTAADAASTHHLAR